MPIMRSGAAPRGRAMSAGRSMVGGRRFAEGGSTETSEQKAARRYRHGSKEYREMKRENLRELSSDMKSRAMNPGKSVVDAAKRVKKAMGMKKGGKCYAKGGLVGIESKGKTKCKMR